MKVAQAEPDDVAALLQAVRLNWRLWTIFQAEITSAECPLPIEIRRNMIVLSNFVDKATVDILAHPLPEKLNVLININREIASGLLATPVAKAEPAPPPPAEKAAVDKSA